MTTRIRTMKAVVAAASLSVVASALVAALPAEAATLTITSPAALPPTVVGLSYDYQLKATGADEIVTWQVTTGAVPAGMTLSSSGHITGTSTTVASNSFTVKATAGAKSVTKAMTLKVSAPVITTKAIPPARTAIPYSAAFGVSGGVAPFTWVATGLPEGLTLDPSSGLLTGSAATAGSYAVAIAEHDSASPVHTAAVKITFTVSPPVIRQAVTDPLVVGVNYHGQLYPVGMFGPATWSLEKGPLPPGLELTPEGKILGAPTVTGSKTVTVRAVDSGHPATSVTASITLAPAKIGITTKTLPRLSTGIDFNFQLHAIGGTPPYKWTGTMPTGLTLHTDGLITGVATAAVSKNVTVTVRDGLNTAASQTEHFQIVIPSPTSHTLAVASESACSVEGGLVYCWGTNGQGQLGLGSSVNFERTPVQVANLTGVTAIDGGGNHYCALLSDKTVWCWGDNHHGAVGVASLTNQLVPVKVTNLSGVTAISAGDDFSCAVLTAGTVKCWGSNAEHELGTGSTAAFTANPVQVASLTGAVDVAAGARHVCALLRNGFVSCWGSNTFGALAQPTGTSNATPQVVANNSVSNTIAISSGDSSTCTLTSAHAVYCWGANAVGQLGHGNNASTATPMLVVNLTGLSPVGISAGSGHVCVVLTDQTARCWGYDFDGELGDGTNAAYIPNPVTVIGLQGAVEIAAGTNTTCARAYGDVLCWGDNSTGQLGNESFTPSNTPVRVLLNDVTAISAGYTHTCAIKARKVYCWGENDHGELGNGITQPYGSAPVLVPGITDAVAISTGTYFSCAARAVGTVLCWGANNDGQVGDGTQVDKTSPTPVIGLSNVVMLTSGSAHTCALQVSGSVTCWGYNGFGQLGVGTGGIHTTPVTVAGVTNATALVAGINHTCALDGTDSQGRSLGRVRCWGDNAQGQLGDGHGFDSSTPVDVAGGFYRGQALAATDYGSCVIGAEVTPSCWGADDVGQLGDNATSVSRPLPVAIYGTAVLTAIDGGGSNVCAIVAGGAVQCTGANFTGQLGNGTTTVAHKLGPVTGITSARLISTGGMHSCAVLTSGSVMCWGLDNWDQLGDGRLIGMSAPVRAGI